jgi:hypothetical protein
MRPKFHAQLGISKEAWEKATVGFKVDKYQQVKFVDNETGIVKRIQYAGPNVMGAMCMFCGAGPMELTNLCTNHLRSISELV